METRALHADKNATTPKNEQSDEEESLTIKLSKKEAKAISVYAHSCNESIDDFVRKALIRDATLADGFGFEDPQYDFGMWLPEGLSAKEQKQFLEENYNKIRAILDWGSISL